MKNQRQLTRVLIAAPLALGLSQGGALAAPKYVLTDLGTLNGTFSHGLNVNDAGQVAGFSYTQSNAAVRAALGLSGTGFQDLGTLGGSYSQGLDINSTEQMAGTSSLSGDRVNHAFLASAGVLQDLGTLGGTHSRGIGLNELGEVTGASNILQDVAEHAFLFSKGKLQDLGTLGGANSQGNDVNSLGQVTGYSELQPSTAYHAALWRNGKAQDLGTLGGRYSEGIRINENGAVTGYATTTGDLQHHAVLWAPGQPIKDLGTLGGNFSTGYGINLAGDVVGYATNGSDIARLAFLWNSAGMQDLNTLILPNTGWFLTEAHGISDNGNIVGVGQINAERHAFLLTPDKIAPVITCPADVKATSSPASIGQATATDNLDPNPAITNNRPATFPGGTTVVTWTATDAAANKAACNQNVTVSSTDTTPPVVSATLTPAAPNGLNGWYVTPPVGLTWSVTDPESAISNKTGCLNSSVTADTTGLTFSCTATSSGGTTGPVSASVRLDGTSPVVAVPANVTATSTDGIGAVVAYPAATATDATSGVNAAGVNCTPASGSSFPVGTTTVNCSASDNAGNVGAGSFTVTVATATPPPTPETIGVSLAECKSIGASSGEWRVQGTSSITVSNSIQLFARATVPADLTSGAIGRPATVASNGQWSVQLKPGPACTPAISLASSATLTVKENIGVTLK